MLVAYFSALAALLYVTWKTHRFLRRWQIFALGDAQPFVDNDSRLTNVFVPPSRYVRIEDAKLRVIDPLTEQVVFERDFGSDEWLETQNLRRINMQYHPTYAAFFEKV